MTDDSDKREREASQGVSARLLRLRRGPWENLATIIIAIGVFMLMQGIAIELYTYSFITILVGTVMFIIVSHFPE